MAKVTGYQNVIFRVLIEGSGGVEVERRASALNEMILRMKGYPGRSIDAFLEHQPKYRQLGHELIAGLMGEALGTSSAERGH